MCYSFVFFVYFGLVSGWPRWRFAPPPPPVWGTWVPLSWGGGGHSPYGPCPTLNHLLSVTLRKRQNGKAFRPEGSGIGQGPYRQTEPEREVRVHWRACLPTMSENMMRIEDYAPCVLTTYEVP